MRACIMAPARDVFAVLSLLFIIIIMMCISTYNTPGVRHQMTMFHGDTRDDVTQTQGDAPPVEIDTSEMRYTYRNSHNNLFTAAEFEADRNNCVIKRFDNITSFHNEPKSQKKCTLTFMHDYFKRTKQFYGKRCLVYQNNGLQAR